MDVMTTITLRLDGTDRDRAQRFDPAAFVAQVGKTVTLVDSGRVVRGFLQSVQVSTDGMTVTLTVSDDGDDFPPLRMGTMLDGAVGIEGAMSIEGARVEYKITSMDGFDRG